MTFGIFHYGGYSLLFYYIIGFAANLHFLTYSFIFHSPFVVLGETIQMITIQLAKDQAAQEFGYESWHDLAFMLKEYPLEKLEYSQYNLAFNRSLEIYAEAKEKEFAIWISKAASSTMENGIWLDLKCNEMTTDELYEVYKTQS